MAAVPAIASSDVKKLSFAKVVASVSKDRISPAMARVPARGAAQKGSVQLSTTDTSANPTAAAAGSKNEPVAASGSIGNATFAAVKVIGTDAMRADKVTDSLGRLRLERGTPSLVVNGSGSTATDILSKAGNSRTPSDDASQLADSNSELGTKPPSLDGKSITSGTTFALDEKESLRPDDSASVKASADDDDAVSIRGSIFANSRMGSEIAARVQRIQLGDMPPRTIITHHTLADPQRQGTATPQSDSSEKQPPPGVQLPLSGTPHAPEKELYSQNPDEKLLEAMQSPKDRLFLLRLEKEVIEFVQDSKEPFMDLPPCNSFCRMLTHKLADYYHMTHSFEAVASAVRIYRTPFCRVPPSLASIVNNSSSASTPPSAVLPRKIMRRGEDGELATASAGPSKPTSEVGSDPKDKSVQQKEKLTREEREEAYNRARERIFGSAEKTDTTPENDDSAGVSRASSVSARDKSNSGKRGKTGKQRRDDSESFDSRSAYTPVYGPQQPAWYPQQFIPISGSQYNGQFQQYPPPLSQSYGPLSQTFTKPIMPNTPFVQQYNNMTAYPPQQTQRFSPGGGPVPGFVPPIQNAPAVPLQNWQPSFTPSVYQPRTNPSPGIPYAYGQLPANTNPNDPKSQHPIPGSYQRHSFNPKTQSFVPGNSNSINSMQPAHNLYSGSASQVPPPPISFNAYQQSIPPQPIISQSLTQPPSAANSSAYGMVRQGSSNSMPPFHGSQHLPQPPPVHPHNPSSQHITQSSTSHIPNKPAVGKAPAQGYSHLPNYGNPATLPQRPST